MRGARYTTSATTRAVLTSKSLESFLSLHELLDEHIEKTGKHIDMIGERVARLGCVPTAHPVTQHELSYVKHEVEGRYTMRDFIRNDLEHELAIQAMMRKSTKTKASQKGGLSFMRVRMHGPSLAEGAAGAAIPPAGASDRSPGAPPR